MADKVYVTKNKLTAVADAIRTKSGTSAALTLDQMPAVVNAIPSGGGGGEDLSAVLDGSIKNLTNNDAKMIKKYIFRDCSIESVSMPNVTRIRDDAFSQCSRLTSVNFPACTQLDNNVFYQCSSLVSAAFPSLRQVSRDTFGYCHKLETLDIGQCSLIYDYAFEYCDGLSALIIRKTDGVCTLSGSQAFNGSTIKKGTGYIYVPDSLVSAYAQASNWSAVASQIKGLSELPTT